MSRAPRITSLIGTLVTIATLIGATVATSAPYPPEVTPVPPTPVTPGEYGIQALIFTNTHSYMWNANPNGVVIKVEVFDNFFGDFSKYHWVYTVTNNNYDPNAPISNGFSGFELMLPQAVPDINDITAPDGIGPWEINCCSGLPVEWDLRNTTGAPVAGGTMPGQTEVYSFTTMPRLIALSGGWFHTWEQDVQTNIVNYGAGNALEVPDVLAPPNQETCCYIDASGAWVCQVLPAGQCHTLNGGHIVQTCSDCPPIVPVKKKSWGKVKSIYR